MDALLPAAGKRLPFDPIVGKGLRPKPGPPCAMSDGIRVFAGDCTITAEGDPPREQRGEVVLVIKPDDTVLVHDRDGYQPVAWLTRPETLAYDGTSHDGRFSLVATDGDSRLRVVANDRYGLARYPASAVGAPIGDCPDCDGTLVRADGAVTCLDCEARYGLPAGADVLDDPCPACGRPTMRAERGRAFTLMYRPRVRVARRRGDGSVRPCVGLSRLRRRPSGDPSGRTARRLWQLSGLRDRVFVPDRRGRRRVWMRATRVRNR